jgi:2-polyprenyl-3-methyl-5-hydroxy-6-metoxy-1,4-benzoquinol methylase
MSDVFWKKAASPEGETGGVRSSIPDGTARYDAFAEWYRHLPWVGSAGLICDGASGTLPERLDGERWLDVACGAGRTARELARRGANVTGVDVSLSMIATAQAEGGTPTPKVDYRVGDITELNEWWDGHLFDGATCEMAFMDIDDLIGTVRSVSEVLRPLAPFLVSMVHPCFPGNDAGLSSWPPERGYDAEGYWTSADHNPEGVRIRVGSSHRTLSTYLNVHLWGGFALERVYEPPTAVPTFLVLAFRRVQ